MKLHLLLGPVEVIDETVEQRTALLDFVAFFAVERADGACHALFEGLILAEAEGETVVVVESNGIVVLGFIWIIIVICVLSD